MKILFLEPFFGGSHKDFALGFKESSVHEVDLLTLPPRFWKWRMRGAALALLDQIGNPGDYDLIFATDMLDLADFKALGGKNLPPVVLYFHENQLSYPLGPHEKRDFHLGFTNIISAHAADGLLFNSQFHLNDFMKAARQLVKQMPDFRPVRVLDKIEQKARILYPGCRFPAHIGGAASLPSEPPLIVWNHRWEYDKDPETFFAAIGKLKQAEIPFSLAVLGEQYEIVPKVFEQARQEFKDEILAWGYVDSRKEYESWLGKGRVVVSTAIQENFGISVMEAVRFGCFPLLPKRLSYPELIPEKFHGKVFYRSGDDFFKKLKELLLHPEGLAREGRELSDSAGRFSWEIMGREYDKALIQYANLT
ncbi:tRNA-queuosine alpha-mannosyltransferase domain-containing protein [Desulfospira joergensenii]|uniref:tRNA-queuosine alpha-mannosyltransferase domain-containing protein n=1 Tax=Desulfospira joergensenii TaxID=53329 RepID=UPI0003B33D5F|nr:DUF3524 domain-containing protein [Desulfospira joergensenii]